MEHEEFDFKPKEILMNVVDQLSFTRLFFLLLIWCIYRLLFVPMNYVKGLYDVGWLENKKRTRNRVIGNIPPVYPNGWFAIAESDRVKIGTVLHILALGENFALFRTDCGQARVLDAYCPHLGANMAVAGKVVGDCLQCPFHLWTFDGVTGNAKSIPNNEKIPKSAKVKSWKTFETNGFIFVWYHAEGEDPSWYPEDIDAINKKELTYFGRNEYMINCHIQEVPENGSDMAHFKALHGATFFSGGDLRYHETKWLKFFRHQWQATWETFSDNGKQHMGISSIEHHITLFGVIKLAKCYITAYQTGPGYVALHVDTGIGPVILLQSVTPVGPMVQKVIHRVYAPSYLFLFTRFFFIAECYMFERDIMIWNNKTYFDQPIYTREDKYIAKFRRWYQQFYSQHSKTYKIAKEGLEW